MKNTNLKRSLLLFGLAFGLTLNVYGQLKDLTKRGNVKLSLNKDQPEQKTAQEEPETLLEENSDEKLPSEIIFAAKEYNSFDEAKAHAVSHVKDGDPLWMYIKTPQPIEKYVDANPNNKDKDGKVRKFINMGIGRQNEPNGDYKACNVIATDEEAASTELRISLSPGTVRKGPSLTCFLDIASGFDPKLRELEIRLYAKVDDDKKVIGRGHFTLDLTNGKDNYTTIAEDFRKRISKGAPENNRVPKKGAFADDSYKNQALKLIRAKEISPLKIYYSVDDWQVMLNNETDVRDHRSLYGAYTYKKADKCLYGVFEVIQNWNVIQGKWMEAKIELRDDFPVSCEMIQ
ncbi:hypothetical protein C900_04167 [Fulvivirga imtechensis AK7]|uniref:Uncharacterized protein n=1 Tax=Fulvivirga imtechensis AK7 TaxID=1237149 RepID=L8JX11_9BACT|nr:hypothetical protein [Fulvivirga imtechensis]ELR73315.1 hypothetical protein C900_04167 [Fulvivirga imtechensis AK7]